MSSTPTPVDDNRLNRNDESMYSAIDKMMSNSEQSYDDFMKSFTHLQTEDLESKQKANKEELQKPPPCNPESVEEITSDHEVRPKNASVTHSQEEENELQEVVLEPGIICGWMNKAGNQSGTVQLDNFTGDHSESENSDLEDLTSGYTASFSMAPSEKASNSTINEVTSQEIQAGKDVEPKPKSKQANMVPTVNKKFTDADANNHSESGSDKDSDTEDIPDALESIDAMKNILLETFLSDFCEEMGLGGMEGMGFGAMSGMDFDESEEHLETDNVDFDDDHLDLLLNITDTGASNAKDYVKDSISKSADSEPVPKTKKKSRSRRRKKNKAQKSEQNVNKNEDQNTTLEQNIDKNKDHNSTPNGSETDVKAGIKTESESNIKASGNSCVKSTEQKSNLHVDKFSGNESYDKESEIVPVNECSVDPNGAPNDTESSEINENDFGGKLLFPGEVEPDEAATAVSTETRLEFKATYRELPEDKTIEQSCSNEVETFVLDENFDYDNVVLTPKYSPEDMEKISALMMGKVTL